MVIEPGNNIGPSSGSVGKTRQSGARSNVENQRAETTGNSGSPTSDQVSLSTQGQRLNRLESAIAGLSDVDLNRVETLRSAIEGGDYEVDARELAQKLLQHEQILPGNSG